MAGNLGLARDKVRKAKPKFSVGQVVFVDDHGFYGLVRAIATQFEGEEVEYRVQGNPCQDDTVVYPESNLRPLTTRERGRKAEK